MYYSQYFTQSFDFSQTDNSRDLILALFNACLTTSSRHFESGPQKSPEGIAWVITQYDLIVHGSLSALEECQVATKVIDMNRFFITRVFNITSQSEKIADLYAQFAVIDYKSRKMQRMVIDGAQDFVGQAHLFEKIGLPAKDSMLETQPLVIQDQDIDENAHVNNKIYLKWALDHLSFLNQVAYNLNRIRVKYGSELLQDHTVCLKCLPIDQDAGQTTIQIYNQSLDKEACRIQIEWSQDIRC